MECVAPQMNMSSSQDSEEDEDLNGFKEDESIQSKGTEAKTGPTYENLINAQSTDGSWGVKTKEMVLNFILEVDKKQLFEQLLKDLSDS